MDENIKQLKNQYDLDLGEIADYFYILLKDKKHEFSHEDYLNKAAKVFTMFKSKEEVINCFKFINFVDVDLVKKIIKKL